MAACASPTGSPPRRGRPFSRPKPLRSRLCCTSAAATAALSRSSSSSSPEDADLAVTSARKTVYQSLDKQGLQREETSLPFYWPQPLPVIDIIILHKHTCRPSRCVVCTGWKAAVLAPSPDHQRGDCYESINTQPSFSLFVSFVRMLYQHMQAYVACTDIQCRASVCARDLPAAPPAAGPGDGSDAMPGNPAARRCPSSAPAGCRAAGLQGLPDALMGVCAPGCPSRSPALAASTAALRSSADVFAQTSAQECHQPGQPPDQQGLQQTGQGRQCYIISARMSTLHTGRADS